MSAHEVPAPSGRARCTRAYEPAPVPDDLAQSCLKPQPTASRLHFLDHGLRPQLAQMLDDKVKSPSRWSASDRPEIHRECRLNMQDIQPTTNHDFPKVLKRRCVD